MGEFTLNLKRDTGLPGNPLSSGAGKIVLQGVIGHLNELTIVSDGTVDFGTRTVNKPVYVSIGTQNGSNLGTLTGDYFHPLATDSADVPCGSIINTVRVDIKNADDQIPVFGEVNWDATKPLIYSIARNYNFDVYSPQAQALTGSTIENPNLKRFRFYGPFGGGDKPNVYISGWRTTGFMAVEHSLSTGDSNTGNIPFTLPAAAWINEEIVLFNSSAPNVKDGQIRQYINGVWTNTAKYLISTKSDFWQFNVSNDTLYEAIINGVSYPYLSDSSAGSLEIANGLRDAVNADSNSPVVAAVQLPNNWLYFTEKNPAVTSTISVTNTTHKNVTTGVYQARLDQCSGGIGEADGGMPTNPVHVGLQIIDQDYKAVYVGNSPDFSTCTKLERMPPSLVPVWENYRIKFTNVESHVLAANSYYYIRTGLNTWANTKGVRN